MENSRSIGRELKMLSNLIRRRFDSSQTHKAVENMTGTHGWLLGYLYDHRDCDVFQRDIENEFGIRRSTVSNILQLMEKNGLITRNSVASDARLKKIELTEKSLQIHLIVADDMEKLEQQLSENISQQELDGFFKVIDKIKNNLEQEVSQ